MNISCSKRLDDAVNLLCFTWKPYVHEQLPHRDIKRVSDEVEALNIRTERPGMEFVRTTATSRSDPLERPR